MISILFMMINQKMYWKNTNGLLSRYRARTKNMSARALVHNIIWKSIWDNLYHTWAPHYNYIISKKIELEIFNGIPPQTKSNLQIPRILALFHFSPPRCLMSSAFKVFNPIKEREKCRAEESWRHWWETNPLLPLPRCTLSTYLVYESFCFIGILPLVAAHIKQQAFVGALDFDMAPAGKLREMRPLLMNIIAEILRRKSH